LVGDGTAGFLHFFHLCAPHLPQVFDDFVLRLRLGDLGEDEFEACHLDEIAFPDQFEQLVDGLLDGCLLEEQRGERLDDELADGGFA
jgi:hypothetical protein